MPSLVVVGSGPGIALSTAALFAEKKFDKVALISRSKSRIQQDQSSLLETLAKKNKTDIEVSTWNVDVNDSSAFKKVLQEVGEKHGDTTCVLFNAAKVAPSELLKYSEEEMIDDFKVCWSSLNHSHLKFKIKHAD